jgi:hypothetical protein
MVDIRAHPEVLKCRIEVRVRELDVLAAETAASTNRIFRRALPFPLAREGPPPAIGPLADRAEADGSHADRLKPGGESKKFRLPVLRARQAFRVSGPKIENFRGKKF